MWSRRQFLTRSSLAVLGTAGTATLSMGPSLTAALEFHKRSNNSWVPWTMTCNLKVTNPAQNAAFSPSITVS